MEPRNPKGLDPQSWAAECNPFELVEVARSGQYDQSKKEDPSVVAANNEIISRFESLTRAGLGSHLSTVTEAAART